MTTIELAGVALAGVNFVLALILIAIYWRNHRSIRSPFTLGLLLFALFLVIHDGLVVYHSMTMMGAAVTGASIELLVEELLQSAALGALVVATMR